VLELIPTFNFQKLLHGRATHETQMVF